MRLAVFLSTVAAASALAVSAHAGPLGPVSTINVSIGNDLQVRADDEDYGPKELEFLVNDLRQSVEQALTRSGDLSATGGTLDLVIEDAVPNRPTMRQLSVKPGLSYESFGIGGAKISGVLTTADGRQIPVAYSWYETDIRWSQVATTWMDVENTFDRFGRRLASGEAVVSR